MKAPARADRAARRRAAQAKVGAALHAHSESGLRQLLTFAGLFAIVLGILVAWNVVQNLDDARGRLWGELAFFVLLVWLAVAVLSILVSAFSVYVLDRWGERRRWLRFLKVDPISIPEAFVWALVVMVSVPLALLFGLGGFAVLIGVTAAVYALGFFARKPRPDGSRPRLPLCYAGFVGTLALLVLAGFSRETDVARAEPAPATAPVPGAAELAAAVRPLLFFDRDERYEPVRIGAASMRACLRSFLEEDCKTVTADAELGDYEYLTITGAALERGERPGGGDSAYYFHVVEDGGRVYVDYWWYFAHNPAPVAPDLLCGPALRWLSQACAEHPADWEGITVVLEPCPGGAGTDECVSGAGRRFRVDEVRYAQHDKVVVYRWEALRAKWEEPALAGWARDEGFRPLVFVALASHASYAAPCPPATCSQIARPAFTERRNGQVPWTNNDDGCDGCLQPLPVDESGAAASWNGFAGRWGAQHCILFGTYCDVQRAPRAPSFQPRYRELDCAREWCVASSRF